MRILAPLLLVPMIACEDPLPADCETVSRGVETYWANRAATAETAAERVEILQYSGAQAARWRRHCKADGWSTDIITCVRVVFRLEDSGCLQKLTPHQAGALLMDEPGPIEGGTGLGS